MNEWEYLINSFNQKVGGLSLCDHENAFEQNLTYHGY